VLIVKCIVTLADTGSLSDSHDVVTMHYKRSRTTVPNMAIIIFFSADHILARKFYRCFFSKSS